MRCGSLEFHQGISSPPITPWWKQRAQTRAAHQLSLRDFKSLWISSLSVWFFWTSGGLRLCTIISRWQTPLHTPPCWTWVDLTSPLLDHRLNKTQSYWINTQACTKSGLDAHAWTPFCGHTGLIYSLFISKSMVLWGKMKETINIRVSSRLNVLHAAGMNRQQHFFHVALLSLLFIS